MDRTAKSSRTTPQTRPSMRSFTLSLPTIRPLPGMPPIRPLTYRVFRKQFQSAYWSHLLQRVPNASFDIDVNFVDYQQQELSLYFVDWHHNVRAQTVTVMDANTRAPLYSQYFTDFSLGVYYTWNITGHVIINIKLEQTSWNPASAVVSGLFFQPPSIVARPTISIGSPTAGQTLTKTITLSTTASSSIGISAVQFELDGYPLGAPVTSGSPFNSQWNTTTTSNGTHQLNAVAIDSSNHAITSAPISVTVSN